MQRSRSYIKRKADIQPTKSEVNAVFLKVVIGLFFVIILFFSIQYHFNHNYSSSPNIKLATTGYCLDDYRDKTNPINQIDAWLCNSTRAQIWKVQGNNIVFDNNYCLSVENSSLKANSKVVLGRCDNEPGQIWVRNQESYQNPNSTFCLSASASNPTGSIYISPCRNNQKTQVWLPVDGANSTKVIASNCSGTEGQLVACNAEKEWNRWQSGRVSHETLLSNYTNGAPYEQWCADFVSYVYKEAGFPFTQGSSSGWDENNANYIQYMGFTVHMASSGYLPKIGDVAYFNYNNGHVEIVIAGGKHPSFIYGDSATIDPSTGNGQMKTNTITGDSGGQVVYYLSPT